jgi:transposase-like protein
MIRGIICAATGGKSQLSVVKGIGEVEVKIPRDRKGEFKTEIIPPSKQYEELNKRSLDSEKLSLAIKNRQRTMGVSPWMNALNFA